MNDLGVYLNGERIGTFSQLQTGRHAFEYAAAWREANTGLPLSLSMPLDLPRYEGTVVTAFFDGLLPDNSDIRRRWGQRFGVSANNPHALLTHMGADCPGALQIIPGVLPTDSGLIPLSNANIAERLRQLREDIAATRLPGDRGQFSLAGAQRKTALHLSDGQWFLPYGTAPTTHILKPPIPGFEAQEANECFCLWLAEELGLITAECRTETFEGERAIIITRFDRYRDEEGRWQRIHMEDMCQALGVPPALKYQMDGGPSPERILALLESSSDPEADKLAFMKALFFNWLVLGTDAHAKNYSLMLGRGHEVLLAPLYDISSFLPYTLDAAHTDLAMKIGGKKQAGEIRRHYWERLARDGGMRVGETMDHLDRMLGDFAKGVTQTEDKAIQGGMNEDFVTRLSQELKRWQQQVVGYWR